MRKFWMGASVLAGAALSVTTAFAQTPTQNEKFTAIAAPDSSNQILPDLAPGEDVAIACDAIERVADPSDVRVVLTIAAAPGDSQTGYKKILAIDEKLTGSAVHLKVPDAPDLANHTVNLNVYVVDGAHNNDCDGGQYRIVQTAPHPRKPG